MAPKTFRTANSQPIGFACALVLNTKTRLGVGGNNIDPNDPTYASQSFWGHRFGDLACRPGAMVGNRLRHRGPILFQLSPGSRHDAGTCLCCTGVNAGSKGEAYSGISPHAA